MKWIVTAEEFAAEYEPKDAPKPATIGVSTPFGRVDVQAPAVAPKQVYVPLHLRVLPVTTPTIVRLECGPVSANFTEVSIFAEWLDETGLRLPDGTISRWTADELTFGSDPNRCEACVSKILARYFAERIKR